jgi:hypothetical protein
LIEGRNNGKQEIFVGNGGNGPGDGGSYDTGNGKDGGGGGLGFTITAPVYSWWTSGTDNTPYTGNATVEVWAFTGEDNDRNDQIKYHSVPGASAVITNGTLTLVLPDTVPENCFKTETIDGKSIKYAELFGAKYRNPLIS